MIYINNLRFTYQKHTWLFDGLDAKFEPGRIYGLLGRNGAGKTTLLKLIAGLRFPGEGTVKVAGFDSYRRLPDMLRLIFVVPEQFTLPNLKGYEYVGIYGDFYPSFDKDKMTELTREFELDLGRKLNEMSYGQKKKFIIAFALASNVPVVLMDEPTNGLDIPSKVKFRQIVAGNVTDDRLFIISTHQVRDVEGLIDDLRIIDRGKMLLEASVDFLIDNLRFEKADQLPADVLYSMKIFGGWQVIRPSDGNTQTNLDLELLFNAVIDRESKLIEFLNSKKQ